MNYIKFLSIALSFVLSFSLSDSLIDYSKLESNEVLNSRENETKSNNRTVTATLISSFQGPSSSIGLTYDGTYLWISDRNENLIKKYTLSGEMVSSIPSPGGDSRGLAWDGQNIWVAFADSYLIYKLDSSDGTILNSFVHSGNGYPNGITFDGASNLWVNSWGSSSLVAYDSETLDLVTELSINGGGRGLTFDGTHLWGASATLVSEINLEGELIETFDLPNTYIPGLAFDGQYIWASNMNTGMVYQYDVGFNSISGCTDPYANNYNSDASENDGTCTYDDPDFSINYSFLGTFENSSYYKSNSDGLNWEEASTHAFNNGGHLATITSQEENDAVSSWITEVSIFGLFQNLNSSEYSEPDGGWEWITGEPLDYTSWYGSEPNNNGGSQNFGVYNFNSPSMWDDQSLIQVTNRVWILERSEDFVLGCNDPYADNYDEGATHDDGSCSGYPDNGDYVLTFDGDEDYVNLGNNNLFNLNDFTVSLWFKSTWSGGGGDWTYLFGRDNHWGFWLQNTGNIRFSIEQPNGVWGNVESEGIFTDGSWHHVSVTRNSETGEFALYIDGIFDQDNEDILMEGEYSSPDLSGEIICDDNLNIGYHPVGSPGWFDGSVDNISVYDRILNEHELELIIQSQPLTNNEGLIGKWKFNVGEDEILYDHSGNQNHGTIIGASWEEVIPGCTDPYAENYNEDANLDDGSCSGYPDNGENTLSFDGVDDYVSVSNDQSLNPVSAMTISFWMKTETSSDDGRFVVNKAIHNSNTATDDSYMMRIHGETGAPAMQIAGGGNNWIWIESSQLVVDGAWHHVAYVFDRPVSYFYINGVYDESGTYPSFDYELNNTAENVYLGSGFHESDGMVGFFDGNLDDIAIWDRALSQEEIQNSMSGLSGDEVGLAGLWKFNSGEDLIVYDHSGNSNHGAISGSAEWSDHDPVVVTFNYDAYNQTVSSNGIHIAGTFNDWSTNASQMTDTDGDSVYTFTAAFTEGDVVEYKFINGNSWDDPHDTFVGDENCVIESADGFNRVITVLSEDTILDPVCLSSCDPCDHPDIDVSPGSLSADLYVGETLSQDLTITNDGSLDLSWTSYVSFAEDLNTIETTSEFGTGEVGDNRKINDDIVSNFDTYASDPIRIPMEDTMASRNGFETPLNNILESFNDNFESVNGVVPNRYDFYDGVSGYYISDGGGDMYDGGNYLYTNLGGPIYYSDNVIENNNWLGEDNQYFTRKVDGLFVFVADIDNIDYFQIDGNIGADGSGNVDGAILEMDLYGKTFLGFVKRVYNAWDPSINHLIIVEEEDGLTHEFEQGTYTDYHRLSGLNSSTRLYYLLYAGTSGSYIDNDETLVIMDAFLNSINLSPAWVDLGSESGTTAVGVPTALEVTIDATEVEGGDHFANVVIVSNDPDEHKVTIPVSLTATVPYPEISVDPSEFSEAVRVSETRTELFTITNSGVADLEWNASILDQSRTGNTYTFTNCDVEGYLGPTQGDLDMEYAGTNLDGMVTSNNGIQNWTVPVSGTYHIEGWGAAGVGSPYTNNELQIVSHGARMSGSFELTAGEEIQILVGQIGVSGNSDYHGAGGGGSFVTRAPHNTNESILLIAGGGGGDTEYGLETNAHASIETYGGASQTGHPGGAEGNGSQDATSSGYSCAGQGAGFFTNGGITNCGGIYSDEVAMSYLNGGQGGEGASERTPWGGFGGGGGSGHGGAGGGGGYSGGGGSWGGGYGGGGGSFNSGFEQDNAAGFNDDNGIVVITLVGPAWVSTSSNNGSIVPGESETIEIVFNAEDIEEGSYEAQMSVSHNDPDTTTLLIPITMTALDDDYPVFISSETATATEDVLFVYQAQAEDPEGMDITYEFIDYPDWMTASADSIYGIPLEGTGDFSFVVTAYDGFLTSELLVQVQFESVPDAPNSFSILNPTPGEEVTSLSVTFLWEESLDPDEGDEVTYTLFYGESISNLQIIDMGSELIYEAPEDLTDNTTYYWKVVAADLIGLTTESNGGYQSFTVNTANDLPGVFELLTPEHASMVTDLTPTFLWEVPIDPDDVQSSSGSSNNRSGSQSHDLSNGNSSSIILSGGLNTFSAGNVSVSSKSAVRTPTNNSISSRSIESYHVYLGLEDTFEAIEPVIVSENSYTPDTDLMEDVVYYWKVVAVDDDSGSTESDIHSFWTNHQNTSPSDFTLLTPTSDEETGFNPIFSWMESADPDLNDLVNYTLYYGYDVTYMTGMELGSELSYASEENLMDNTEYFWQVVATDLSGATYATSLQSFRVNSENDSPEGFILVSPENGSILSESSQILVWSLSTDLDGDLIEFDVHLNGESIGLTDHNYLVIDNLMEDENYTWSVTATDNNGGVTESEEWSFSVNTENAPPESFALLSPEPESIFNNTSVTFEWEISMDTDLNDEIIYHLEIHMDSTHMMYETYENIFTVDGLMDNNIYHWSVTAHDMNGSMTESINGPRMFVVNIENEAPSEVSMITPTENSIETNLSPLFYWTEASDPDPLDHVSYHLILTQDIAGSMVEDIVIDSNSYSFGFDLEDNSDYYWKVNTLDSHGLETIAPNYVAFFTDAFPEPPLSFVTIAPENDASGLGTEVEFLWNSTSDPDPGDLVQYQLIYATDWDDSTTYIFSEIMQDTTLIITLEDNREYSWKVLALDQDDFSIGSNDDTPATLVVGTLSLDGSNIPELFALHQNYPNPFNPSTQIKYDLPQDALVKITIYNILGRNIKSLVNSNQLAGYRSVQWDATNDQGESISAGMYIYTIQAGDFRQTKKMVLLK